MAKLLINKDIVADDDKMMKWYLTGSDGVSYTDIQSFLSSIDSLDNVIDIELHSCGGDTSEGYAIYDAIRATGKEISCTVVGRCASMASVILLSAPIERRKMYPHAKILIHSPYLSSYEGDIDLETIESIKSSLDAERERMIAVYIERTGVERSLIEAQMDKASWFGGETAKQLGFISEVLMPISAKFNQKMSDVTVGKSWLDKLLAKAGYAKMEDAKFAGMDLTTADGETLTVEREEGDAQVGDKATPDGEFVMPDGTTIVVVEGVITEIREAEEESNDDSEALKARIAELEAENASLKTSARSDSDVKVLAAVAKAGGEDWLRRVTGSYTPPKKSGTASGSAKSTVEKTYEEQLRERFEAKKLKK